MKIVAIQNHSKNNEYLYNLTIKNHIDYYNMYGINSLNQICSYSPFIDVDMIIFLLMRYDYVFSIGSDCLFTNFHKNIFDFFDLNKNINICQEGFDLSLVNGEIIVFKDGCQPFLKQLKILQENNPEVLFGSQSIIHAICLQQTKYANENFNIIKAGTLQKYLFTQKDAVFRRQHAIYDFNSLLWNKGDFLLHTLGGTNEEKFNLIKEIKDKYDF